MSGRGLGHTGGTLDKLESIPGFRVELSTDEFVAQVREAGMAIIGASANLVPADKKLYALRDVTATVDNYSLIAASIMSKKIAGGAEAIVIDAKVGDGAFMKSVEDARALAEAMLDLAHRADREVVCLLTDMNRPLGRAVGNSLEIREAIATVRGEGPPDFLELVLEACSRLLAVSDLHVDQEEGRDMAARAIADGSALAAYERWIRAQGGDPDEGALPTAPIVKELTADRGGYVAELGAVAVGLAALHLGAGRQTKDDSIDHSVGIVCLSKPGDQVDQGEALAEIHAATQADAEEAARELRAAYILADEAPPRRSVILDVIA
jgi:pyrimidine-nucleoside phosphorylase